MKRKTQQKIKLIIFGIIFIIALLLISSSFILPDFKILKKNFIDFPVKIEQSTYQNYKYVEGKLKSVGLELSDRLIPLRESESVEDRLNSLGVKLRD